MGSTREPVSPPRSPKEDWLGQLARLQALVTACPSDLLSRCELATLLETMNLYEEALVHWKLVIDLDANGLSLAIGGDLGDHVHAAIFRGALRTELMLPAISSD